MLSVAIPGLESALSRPLLHASSATISFFLVRQRTRPGCVLIAAHKLLGLARGHPWLAVPGPSAQHPGDSPWSYSACEEPDCAPVLWRPLGWLLGLKAPSFPTCSGAALRQPEGVWDACSTCGQLSCSAPRVPPAVEVFAGEWRG